MRNYIVILVVLALMPILACGGGDQNGAAGEARIVQQFLDNILQEGDLSEPFAMLVSEERMAVGMHEGFYDLVTGKDDENVSEDVRLWRVKIDAIVPVPENVLSYEVGDATGEGDTLDVPVTFSIATDNLDDFLLMNIDPETYEKMNRLDSLDMPFEEKKQIIRDVISQAKSAVKGKTFEMETKTVDFYLIKQDGAWKVSFLRTGLLNALSGL
ncbi:MAG TPA: hypothetical protein ENO22_06900 [candidate division Zixibacteria bacterium]|nr:hypothetical protein [candidate division Zixibacteria bacterium]